MSVIWGSLGPRWLAAVSVALVVLSPCVRSVSAQTTAPKTFVPFFSETLTFPNNTWNFLQATLVVPDVPPAGTGSRPATYFLWVGVQPSAESANLEPIGNGVLQTVAAFGPNCAPGQPSLGSPYRGWSSSPEYVNLNTTLIPYQGCRGGAFMDALPTDRLKMTLWSTGDDIPNRSLWRQRIERFDSRGSPLPCLASAFGSGTPCSVYYELEMLAQEQRFAQLMVEYDGFANQTFLQNVQMLDVTLVAKDSEPQFCGTLNAEGDRVQGSFGMDGVASPSGCEGLTLINRTACTIRRCQYLAAGVTPTPLPTPTSTDGIGPTQTGVPTDLPAPSTSWFDSLSSGTQAGFIIGMVALGLLVFGLIGYLLWRNRKKGTAAVGGEQKKDEEVVGVKEKGGMYGTNGFYGAADAIQAPPPAMQQYPYPYPMFYPGPENGDLANGSRPASMYSLSYPMPYMPVPGNRASWNPRASMYSVASTAKPRSTKSAKVDGAIAEEDVEMAAAAAANRLSYPAAAATGQPRPRSMFVPGTAATTASGRPLTGTWDNHAPVIMAAQQPVFVGPDGGYYVSGPGGMEKVNTPPGFYPAPPLVFVPAGWGAVEEEDEEGDEEEAEAGESAEGVAVETKGKEPGVVAPSGPGPAPRTAMKKEGNGNGNKGSRMSVQLPPEAGVVVPAKPATATISDAVDIAKDVGTEVTKAAEEVVGAAADQLAKATE